MGGHGSARNSPLDKSQQAARVTRHRKNQNVVDVDKFAHGRPGHRRSRPNRQQHGRRTRQGPNGGLARHTKHLGVAAKAARDTVSFAARAAAQARTPPTRDAPPTRASTTSPARPSFPARALAVLILALVAPLLTLPLLAVSLIVAAPLVSEPSVLLAGTNSSVTMMDTYASASGTAVALNDPYPTSSWTKSLLTCVRVEKVMPRPTCEPYFTWQLWYALGHTKSQPPRMLDNGTGISADNPRWLRRGMLGHHTKSVRYKQWLSYALDVKPCALTALAKSLGWSYTRLRNMLCYYRPNLPELWNPATPTFNATHLVALQCFISEITDGSGCIRVLKNGIWNYVDTPFAFVSSDGVTNYAYAVRNWNRPSELFTCTSDDGAVVKKIANMTNGYLQSGTWHVPVLTNGRPPLITPSTLFLNLALDNNHYENIDTNALRNTEFLVNTGFLSSKVFNFSYFFTFDLSFDGAGGKNNSVRYGNSQLRRSARIAGTSNANSLTQPTPPTATASPSDTPLSSATMSTSASGSAKEPSSTTSSERPSPTPNADSGGPPSPSPPSSPDSTTGSKKSAVSRRSERASTKASSKESSPASVTVLTPCPHPGCNVAPFKSVPLARIHVNTKHIGLIDDKWIRDTGSAVCGNCSKILESGNSDNASTYNKFRNHRCDHPTFFPVNNILYMKTTVGTFRVTECGSSFTTVSGVNVYNRCALLAAAHVMGGTPYDGVRAGQLEDGIITYLRSGDASRDIPTAVMNSLGYSNIESRIQTFLRRGFADDIELIALSAFTGCAVDIYEPTRDPTDRRDKAVVISHVAPNASESKRIRMWRRNNHFQSITPCPPPQQPPRSNLLNTQTQTPMGTPPGNGSPLRLGPQRPPSAPRRAASATTVEATPNGPAARTRPAKKDKVSWVDRIIAQFTAYGNEKLLLTRRNMALVIFRSARAPIEATDDAQDAQDPMKATDDSSNDEEGGAYDEPVKAELLPPIRGDSTSLPKNIRDANLELAIGQVGRAKSKLLSQGILSVDNDILDKLRLKYPPKSTTAEDPPSPLTNPRHDPDPDQDVCTIAPDSITALISKKSKFTGCGHDGWSFGLIKMVLQAARKRNGVYTDVVHGLTVLINDIANNRLDTPDLVKAQTTLRGVPLRKGDTNDVRPIGIGELFVTIAGTLAVRTKTVQQLIPEAVGPTELMHGINGGIEALVHIIRGYFHLHPDHVAVKTDISNAFNNLDRRWVLRAATCYPPLVPLAKLLYSRPTAVIYSECTNKDTIDHEIIAECGTTQGEPLAALLFSTSLKIAVDHVLLSFPTVTCRGIADDRIFMGPVNDVLDAVKMYELAIAVQGLKLNRSKTKLYKQGHHGGIASVAAECRNHGIVAVDGFLAGGAPIGDAQFVQDELKSTFDYLAHVCEMIRQLYIYNKTTKKAKIKELEGVTHQDIYRIIRWCVSPSMTNHLLRSVAPDVIKQQVARFDKAVYDLFLSLLDTNADDELCSMLNADGVLTNDIVRLRASMGGLSIGSAAKTAHQAYIGSLCLVLPLVKSALGDSFTSIEAANLFPELSLALNDGSLAPIKVFKDVTLDTLLNKPVVKVQRALGGVNARKAAADILERIVDPKDKAWFLSGREHGATWLTAYPSYSQGLNDNQWCTLVRSRLNLVVVKGFDGTDTVCPDCADTQSQSEPSRRLQRNGTHALHCMQSGRGGARGQRSTRAMTMKFTIIDALRPAARKSDLGTGYLCEKEPIVTDYYPPKAGAAINSVNNRADFAIYMGAPFLADAVLTHPTPSSHPTSVKTPGAAAAAASKKKLASYYSLFDIPVGRLVPFSYETGGFVCPQTMDFIRSFVKYGMATGAETEPDWTPYNRAEYASRLRSICDSICINIARSVANTLIAGSTALSSRLLADPLPSP